jgi:nitroreductase
VVVCDLRHFVTVGERNQAWIDGGMFAMSLVYALHALGLGTCFLNWSVTEDVDRKLRPHLKVTEHDVIITMLAVGHLPERFRVAHSQRKPIDQALVLED